MIVNNISITLTLDQEKTAKILAKKIKDLKSNLNNESFRDTIMEKIIFAIKISSKIFKLATYKKSNLQSYILLILENSY